LDSHLMFDAGAGDVVVLARLIVLIQKLSGYQEQGNALGACGSIGHAGKYQMDDVGRQVVLTTGDEDLAAGYGITVVFKRSGAGADDPQICSGMRLGQAHRRGPLSAVE